MATVRTIDAETAPEGAALYVMIAAIEVAGWFAVGFVAIAGYLAG